MWINNAFCGLFADIIRNHKLDAAMINTYSFSTYSSFAYPVVSLFLFLQCGVKMYVLPIHSSLQTHKHSLGIHTWQCT